MNIMSNILLRCYILASFACPLGDADCTEVKKRHAPNITPRAPGELSKKSMSSSNLFRSLFP